MFGLDTVKVAIVAAAVVACLSTAAALYHGIQAAEAAKIELQQAKLVAAAQHAQDERSIEALQTRADQAAALEGQVTQLKEAINAAPVSHSCLASPAGRVFSAWLHNGGSFPGASAKSAAQSLAVPGPTSSPR